MPRSHSSPRLLNSPPPLAAYLPATAAMHTSSPTTHCMSSSRTPGRRVPTFTGPPVHSPCPQHPARGGASDDEPASVVPTRTRRSHVTACKWQTARVQGTVQKFWLGGKVPTQLAAETYQYPKPETETHISRLNPRRNPAPKP
jgi:hypothetical protein